MSLYYPYFRGKQYELITLREMASALALSKKIIPIIEPVKENHAGLQKCIHHLKEENLPFIMIINPKYGDFKNDNTLLVEEILKKELKDYDNFQVGYIVNSESDLIDISSTLLQVPAKQLALIHYGYPDGSALASHLKAKAINIATHVFIDGRSGGKLYQKHFKGSGTPILVRDGFKKLKNADYPDDEHFSELQVVYEDEGVKGFGDFLTVGDDYTESGGPAYAIAIHLTYFRKDQVMNIKHFKSIRTDSPVDPAGKFLEALQRLADEVKSPDSLVSKTNSVEEFLQLYDDGHFPGLGYVKKLSMKHHIELMLGFLEQ